MTNSDEPSWKTNPRRDKAQLAMLLRCSQAKDMAEWKAWREANPKVEIWLQKAQLKDANLEGAGLNRAHLQGADLSGAHLEKARLRRASLEGTDLRYANLEGAELRGAHLERAQLWRAHLEEARLWGAHLERADLWEAHLERGKLGRAYFERAGLNRAHLERASLSGAHLEEAELGGAHLEGADLRFAVVDGQTLFDRCTISRETDFTGVALGECRIAPGLKQTLEYNIRRKRWKQWYADGPKWHWAYRWPVWVFWQMSDYGKSTWRIAAAFAGLSVLFAMAYRFLPGLVVCSDGKPLAGLWHAVYFSVVTMTTLGFGDIHASRGSGWGQSLLMLQVILGYVLLGAIVCRLAILFQAGGPAAKFSNPPKPEPEEAGDTDE